MSVPRILIAGGGYVGFYAARRLEKLLNPGEADVVLVSPENFMLYRPLLPEVAAGTLEPRHAAVPLREALRRTRVVSARLVGLDPGSRRATLQGPDVAEHVLDYDQLAVALGGMTRVLPIPGLVDQALGFTSMGEAVQLRDQILGRLELASATSDPEVRQRALTFVFVGGGYTGVEALAELHDMACDVVGGYGDLSPQQLRFVLVEATDRLIPSLEEDLAARALEELRGRGIDVRLETNLENAEGGLLRLSDGSELDADTLVWAAGVSPHGVVGELGLPTDEGGRLRVDACLRVLDADGVWAAGDCASVPDLVTGGTCPPTAQYAVRQGRQLGDNLAAAVRSRRPQPFRYASRGQFVTLGKRKGVAEVLGRSVRGGPAWLVRRSYYGLQIPTPNRKLRVFLDWAAQAPFGHDVVSLGSRREPRAAFLEAAGERD